jgi:hypothetical protein
MEDKKTSLGEPMYVESLMTREEWNKRMRDFPGTSRLSMDDVNRYKTNSFKWRFGMGRGLSEREIDNHYRNLDYIKLKAKSNEKSC